MIGCVLHMKKKWLVAITGVMLTFSLAACSKTVATTSGGKITQDQYYSSLKNTTEGKQVLQQMILDKVLEKQYGSKVSDKTVETKFNEMKKQYGSEFDSVLQQNDMTRSQFKKQIRQQLLLKEAVAANTTITEKQLKKQWKTYQPKVTVAQILVEKKSDAQSIIDNLKNDGSYANFKKLAKEKSQDSSTKNDGGKLPAFDNTDTQLDDSFKKAAFKLKQGTFSSEPVKTEYGYHVIYSIKNPGKGSFNSHKQELKDQILDERTNDSDVLQKVVSKVLKKGNVSIKDKDLQNVLSSFIQSSETK